MTLLCGGCRPAGTCRLGVEGWELGGETVTARAVCPQDATGGPDIAHGGWTSAVFDDVLGRLPRGLGLTAVTAVLTVRYLLPVPADRPVVVAGRLVRREGSRLHVLGEMRLESTGALLATGEAEMAVVDDGHVPRHRTWLSEQDERPVRPRPAAPPRPEAAGPDPYAGLLDDWQL
ncbi:MAG: PaaI family thioesterase [Frankiales bacterium]|nr:PaaI family thioesterase [Frankiales bacterium]